MSLPEIPQAIGDYQLLQLVDQNDQVYRFRATQNSVGRAVLFTLLHADASDDEKQRFRENIRAKAQVDHSNISSIFEAGESGGFLFFTSEFAIGNSLRDLVDRRETMPNLEIVQLLKVLAESSIYLESQNISTGKLHLDRIFYDAHRAIHLPNLARAGQRHAEESVRDILYLGRQLAALIAEGSPGASRLQTLLAWMRGKEREHPLHWNEVLHFCHLIESQLNEENFQTLQPKESAVATQIVKGANRIAPVLVGLLIGGLVIGGTLYWAQRNQKEKTPPPLVIEDNPSQKIPAGEVNLPLLNHQQVSAFEIDSKPVSIADYQRFLESWNQMDLDQQKKFHHPNQPPEKNQYIPSEWQQQLSAAESNASYEGKSINLNSPVTGVDFWDAYVFANTKGRTLPSLAQLFHASQYKPELQIGKSVDEWSDSLAKKPSLPMAPPFPLIVKFVISGNQALAAKLEPLFVDSQISRAANLGFRTCRSND